MSNADDSNAEHDAAPKARPVARVFDSVADSKERQNGDKSRPRQLVRNLFQHTLQMPHRPSFRATRAE